MGELTLRTSTLKFAYTKITITSRLILWALSPVVKATVAGGLIPCLLRKNNRNDELEKELSLKTIEKTKNLFAGEIRSPEIFSLRMRPWANLPALLHFNIIIIINDS